MRSATIAASLIVFATFSSPARAQVFPDPPSLALDRFQPPSSTNRILMLPTSQTLALFDFSAALAIDWAKTPLQIPQGESLVGNQLTAQLLAAFGVGRVEVGFALPFVPFQTTDYDKVIQNFSNAALGDLRLDAKVRLTPKEWRFGGAFQAIAGFPTGQGKNFISESGFSFAGRLIGDVKFSVVTLAAYLGYRYRTSPAIFYNLYVADEIIAGLGIEVTLLHEILDLFGESYGSFGVRTTTDNNGRQIGREAVEFPLEAIFGVRVNVPMGFAVSVAAGTGFLHGYGEPVVRVIGGLSYTRAAKDTDNDGVVNANDKCPTIPEDKDGFQDDDGCPEAGHGPDAVKVGANSLDVKGRVFFDTGSDRIQDRSYRLLDTIATVINLHKEIPKVVVAGHTDSRGNPDKNRELSQKRAESVVKYLVSKGVFPDRLEAKGYGFDEPLLPNANTTAEHEVNRRVEFRIER